MLEKLKEISMRYRRLAEEIAKPESMNDMDTWRAMVKEHASLEEIVAASGRYEETLHALSDCREMLEEQMDPEMKELVKTEITELENKKIAQEEELKTLLLPKDENDDKDVILEIRAGTGGDEAALFGADILRMYLRYAERRGYHVETMDENMTEMGGVKEIVLSIGGKHGVYSRLKYESGVHRVQRVPETESQGRIHTSAATVVVMPEVDDVQVDLKESDIRIDIFRSGGAGGQNVNKVSSAIRMTHIPTGIVVQCQDERSQLKNKEKALRILKGRLFDLYQSQQNADLASQRKSMVGSGDRSERIRTYNFPQNRVTDHRIGMTLYKLDQFMDGDIDEMIDALILADRARKLSAGGDQD